MEAKYYTPEIEEFHVGFEYEILALNGEKENKNDWNKFVFGAESDVYAFDAEGWSDYLQEILNRELIRVKLLYREDIESLGWVKSSRSEKFCCNGRYFLVYNNEKWIISDLDTVGDVVRFQGTIKNKSELQKLMIQTGILEK